ncbi:MAG: DUF4430 domain-containing protein, partial [Oscillospiraceae bacterium]|nr:DUF4430 domain-containing protein [Oscillospiraceae bacterium]
TVSGLVEGSNIIKLENDGRTDYQVIRAKEISFDISSSVSDDNGKSVIYPGSKVSVHFNGLTHPANKLSGIYNNSAQIFYIAENGDKITGKSSQYTFESDDSAHTIEFKIPSDFTGNSYTLSGGCIMTGGFGSAFGSHRYMTYDKGQSPDFDIISNTSYLCMLPDITVPVSSGGQYIPDEPLTITVSVYDYTAVKNKAEGASETGVVLSPTEITVDSSVSAADAVKKVFEENGISYEGLSEGYLSSINGLSSVGGYSGWMLSHNNDDYSNWGLGYINLSDGDNLRFDYSCNIDCATDDIGNGIYGRPFITDIKYNDKEIKLYKSFEFDENGNISESFFAADNKELKGDGSFENPFEIILPASEKPIESIDISTNLDEHYRIVSGISEDTDFSEDNVISISSLGGKYKTYYILKPTEKKPSPGNSGSSGSSSNDTISVTFRLIGATKSSGDVDLSRGKKGYNGSEYVTWIKSKVYKLKKGATAYDLIEKALNENGLDFKGDGYISSVTAPDAYGGYDLKEFTNGSYSGWMYTANGIHPDVPANQYILKNSSKIILHYTNDLRYESAGSNESESSEFLNAWLSAADKEPSEETNKSSRSGSASKDTEPTQNDNQDKNETPAN